MQDIYVKLGFVKFAQFSPVLIFLNLYYSETYIL